MRKALHLLVPAQVASVSTAQLAPVLLSSSGVCRPHEVVILEYFTRHLSSPWKTAGPSTAPVEFARRSTNYVHHDPRHEENCTGNETIMILKRFLPSIRQ